MCGCSPKESCVVAGTGVRLNPEIASPAVIRRSHSSGIVPRRAPRREPNTGRIERYHPPISALMRSCHTNPVGDAAGRAPRNSIRRRLFLFGEQARDMSLTAEALYYQLGSLLAESPELAGPATAETDRWIARASELVELAGGLADKIQLRVATENLNGM